MTVARLIRGARAGTRNQPNRRAGRVPVAQRILEELDRTGNIPLPDERFVGPFWNGRRGRRTGLAKGRTYGELARAIYGTGAPTAAQLKAVARAAKRLERARRIELGRGTYGAVAYRLPTEADSRIRAELVRRAEERLAARARAAAGATAYPVDSGYGGIIEVEVEPVLVIGDNGVELREVAA
jgi:hypothetical protein